MFLGFLLSCRFDRPSFCFISAVCAAYSSGCNFRSLFPFFYPFQLRRSVLFILQLCSSLVYCASRSSTSFAPGGRYARRGLGLVLFPAVFYSRGFFVFFLSRSVFLVCSNVSVDACTVSDHLGIRRPLVYSEGSVSRGPACVCSLWLFHLVVSG